ncbi:LOW QUALITY PROTEIN: hypothetical protein YC2023_034296 [Brassica napus]
MIIANLALLPLPAPNSFATLTLQNKHTIIKLCKHEHMIKSGASCTSPVYEPASTSPFQASSHPMSFVGEKSVSQHNSSPFLLLHIFLVGFSVRLRSRKDSHGEGKAEKNNPGWSKFGSENPPPANFPAPTPSMVKLLSRP